MKSLALAILLVAATPFVVEWTVGQPGRLAKLKADIAERDGEIKALARELGIEP